MQYIAEYRNISQCCTIGSGTQSKYASTVLKYFSSVTHNTHVDDTKTPFKYSNAILAIIAISLLAIIVILYFNIAQPYSKSTYYHLYIV